MNLRNAWCAFARDGDPSHPGIGAWPIHDVTARPTMCFARDTRVVDDPDGAARAAWQALARG
jgi:para-nitrobenzyl esterase